MKKVAILTNFSKIRKAYSVEIIMKRQLKMLINHGYQPKLFCLEGYSLPEDEYPGIEYVYFPPVKCHNTWIHDKTFDNDVLALADVLGKNLSDVDVVLSHDLIYQAALYKFDTAVRRIAQNFPNIKWLNWIHSATTMRENPLPLIPNADIIFPNYYDVPRVANVYNCEEDRIKVIPHPADICSHYGMDSISEKIVKDKNLLQSDIICVYPLRLDRGKQPEYCIKIIAQIKKIFQRSVRMVFVDFHSTGGDKPVYRKELKNLALDLQLNDQEVFFTSEFDTSLSLECAPKIVSDLMNISNVFILPSKSETFSLIAQEAALSGCFMVLNFDFPPMRSIYGAGPVYMKFSSGIDIMTGMPGETITKYEDEMQYMGNIAAMICRELIYNRVLATKTRIRKEHNMDTVFKRYYLPIIEG